MLNKGLIEGGNFDLFWWKKECVAQTSVKFVLLVNKIMHVFAREGGNAELFWWKYERVVQREWQVCFVSKHTMHLFAGGDGNFDLFWWKYERVVQRGWQVCVLLVIKTMHVFARRDAILTCSGAKRNVLSRGSGKFVLLANKLCIFLPEGMQF